METRQLAGNVKKRKDISIESLKSALASLMEKMTAAVQKKHFEMEHLHEEQKISAINLIQYLALRSEDIRSLQDELHVTGLSCPCQQRISYSATGANNTSAIGKRFFARRYFPVRLLSRT